MGRDILLANKKYWEFIGPLLTKCANESFEKGELLPTFRTGLIKIIPKKGDAKRVDDWRPITLLCCGYKLISGVVAGRLETYLKKNTGRGQKGFLNFKNISSCTINIVDNISQSWSTREKMGVLGVWISVKPLTQWNIYSLTTHWHFLGTDR